MALSGRASFGLGDEKVHMLPSSWVPMLLSVTPWALLARMVSGAVDDRLCVFLIGKPI